jgi:hypothetical protein
MRRNFRNEPGRQLSLHDPHLVFRRRIMVNVTNRGEIMSAERSAFMRRFKEDFLAIAAMHRVMNRTRDVHSLSRRLAEMNVV